MISDFFYSVVTVFGFVGQSDLGMLIAGLALASFSFAGFYRLTGVDIE